MLYIHVMWWSMAHQNTRFFSRLMCVVFDVCARHLCVFMRQLFFNHLISFYISWWVQKPIYVKVSIADTHNIQADPHSGHSFICCFVRCARSINSERKLRTHRSMVYRYTWASAHITLYTFDIRHAAKANVLPASNYSPLAMYILHI